MGASMSAVGLAGLVLGDDVGTVLQVHGLACVGRREGELCLVLQGVHGVERHALEVRVVVAGGLHALERELGSDVLGGQLVSARAGTAAFEQIERQELHVGADFFWVDGGSGGAGGGGQTGHMARGLLRVCQWRGEGCGKERRARVPYVQRIHHGEILNFAAVRPGDDVGYGHIPLGLLWSPTLATKESRKDGARGLCG